MRWNLGLVCRKFWPYLALDQEHRRQWPAIKTLNNKYRDLITGQTIWFSFSLPGGAVCRAILKGFIDYVFAADFAYFIRKSDLALSAREIRLIIVSHNNCVFCLPFVQITVRHLKIPTWNSGPSSNWWELNGVERKQINNAKKCSKNRAAGQSTNSVRHRKKRLFV